MEDSLIDNAKKIIKPVIRYSEFAKKLDKTKPINSYNFEYMKSKHEEFLKQISLKQKYKKEEEE